MALRRAKNQDGTRRSLRERQVLQVGLLLRAPARDPLDCAPAVRQQGDQGRHAA